MHFENADIIFVDPCYFAKDDGVWEEYCEDFAQNKSLDKLGCEQSICISVGDVSPDVLVNENDGSVLGSICTDSYVLGCFKLEDVLEYNPEYTEDMEKYPDSFTVIKGFTGDVVFETKKNDITTRSCPSLQLQESAPFASNRVLRMTMAPSSSSYRNVTWTNCLFQDAAAPDDERKG